ncbi:iron transporter biosynthesis regulating transcription factor, partial [Wallemia mellicola CBS 633.66]
CSNCGTSNTPLWRRGLNDQTLCNACGLYEKNRNTPRPTTLQSTTINQSDINKTSGSSLQCANCGTTTTPLWRRTDDGKPQCNACGLYQKLHNAPRPVHMKKTIIKRRKRVPSS